MVQPNIFIQVFQIMRHLFPLYCFAFILLLCVTTNELSAQLSVKGLQLPYGQNTVGYRHYIAYDSSRTYTRAQDWTNEKTARPIPISVWYPAIPDQPGVAHLSVFDYLKILKVEEEWEHLPDPLIMSWFEFPNSPENQQRIKESCRAVRDAEAFPGQFPVVVYAASFLASSTENFALCEFLASHGYLVLAIPGRGADSRPMQGTALKNAEAQARDLEFLIQESMRLPNASTDDLATLDYSFGGLAAVTSQMRNDRIKAMVSLDGRSRYDYETVMNSPSAEIENIDVPFLHFAQKPIPEEVLIADNIDPKLNEEFRLFDSLRYSDAYAVRMHSLSHRHFSTMGLLLKNKDPRQDREDQAVMSGHRNMSILTLSFLSAHLSENRNPAQFPLTAAKIANATKSVISIRKKRPEPRPFTFRDFHDSAAQNAYQDLETLHKELRLKHPDMDLKEWQFNNLGLQLGFDPANVQSGINIYKLALTLFPDSGNLHDSLAEVLLNANKREEAAHHFRESLRLTPDNSNAKARLIELKE